MKFYGKYRMPLNEVTRWEIIRRSQREAPIRFQKKANYRAKDFNNVDFKDLFENDNFTWSSRVGDYIVTISFEGAFDLLQYQLKSMKGKNRWKRINHRMLVDVLSKALDTEDLFIDCTCPDFCLVGDTKIKLLNGNVVTVADMLQMYKNNEELWVYSTDENGDFKPGKVNDVWITGYASELIKVTLNNGKEIVTTPNHRYMLRNGEYLEASKLTEGQSLMPLYFHVTKETYSVITPTPKEMETKVHNVEIITLEESVPVYDISVEKYNNFYVDAGVILHNCYRFAYWATQADCKYGLQQNRPPTVRNVKNNHGYCCKHILAVLYGKRWVPAAAKSWLDFIRANPELSEWYIWGTEMKPDNIEDSEE